MNFIKVGKSFINLDNVNEVRPGILGSVDVYFGGIATTGETLEYNVTNYDGAEAEALVAWLDSIATDVVEQHAHQAEIERQTAAFTKLRALGYALGIGYSDQVQPSFPGTRERAAYALSVTDSVQAEFLSHCAQCGIAEPDEDTQAEWQRNFVSGVLSR